MNYEAKENLEEAFELLEKAISLIQKAKKGSHSLNEQYSYTLELIIQDISLVTDNAIGVMTRSKNIQDILDSYGDKWGPSIDKFLKEDNTEPEAK